MLVPPDLRFLRGRSPRPPQPTAARLGHGIFWACCGVVALWLAAEGVTSSTDLISAMHLRPMIAAPEPEQAKVADRLAPNHASPLPPILIPGIQEPDEMRVAPFPTMVLTARTGCCEMQ
jgi:hypothetical protein